MKVSEYLEVLNPGMQSLIVDQGRVGHLRMGITHGGPADKHACQWANYLSGNGQIQASIECLGAGMMLRASAPCCVAVTGAAEQVRLNDQILESWQSYLLAAGDELELLPFQRGLRSYISVLDGIQAAVVFNSATTVVREKLGGLDKQGTPLQKGDQLPIKSSQKGPLIKGITQRQSYPDKIVLRVVEGYQQQDLDPVSRAQFYTSQYQVTAQTDRMGVRLAGAAVKVSYSILSEGICRGAVQIPPDGQPIVMLNDCQTIGGYPKMGSVLSLDCDKLAQAQSGTRLIFEPIDCLTAHNLMHLYRANSQRARSAF